MTPSLSRPQPPRLWADAPLFTALALLIGLAALPLTGAALIDSRQFQGDGIWIKPLKFHAALVIYLVTLAFFARYLPATLHRHRVWRAYLGFAALTIIAELLWIGGAAALGTASHFNVTSAIWAVLYGLMGFAAVTLTSLSLAMGIAIWRNPATGLPPALHLAIALGLILTFVLTVIAAGTMSAQTGHLVGTPTTGLRVPLIGWSREVGDLRVAHFFATHALHVIPLAGLLTIRMAPATGRLIVLATSAVFSALTAFAMWQALQGQPFLPWLG